MLPLLASAAGCSSSSGGSDNVATDADEAALGDGEVTGLLPGGDSPPAASPAVPAGSSAGPSVALPADADTSAGEEASSADGASAPAPVPPGDDLVPADPIQPQPGTLTAGVWDDNRNLDRFLGYRAELEQLNMPGMLGFSAAEHEAARDAFAQRSARTTLDVALVIDTTGSMGDEISYLQTEFLAISAAIESKYPNAEQRWSLVLYKDEGDEYVTRWFDFRSDAQEFRARLAEQYASGGGDFPEAPDAAFEIMNQLAWRSDPNTARLAFWVADAPHHVDNAEALKVGVEGAEAQDIHVYPVASSGIDELTELTMRSAAQLTGGRYLFLTNDSGVGNSHKEPSIPCYFVTQLDSAILRMVDVEMTGQYREPSAEELVRANGNPEGGTCTLASGQPAFAF